MLDGFVPFPAEVAARYRAAGYWRDEPLRDVFSELFGRWSDRVALIDGDRSLTFADIEERAAHVACRLHDLGLRPRDVVLVQLPNVAEFAVLFVALQSLGAIPVLALPSHRHREISQFVRIGGAVATFTPRQSTHVDHVDIVRRVRDAERDLRLSIVLGEQDGLPEGFLSFEELEAGAATATPADLARLSIDPCDPALFLLSGGTTGIPKLIPRTHNDYAYNFRAASAACEVTGDDVLLDVLPIGHNFPLACPGLLGFWLNGATVVFSTSTAPADVFALVERHHITHIHAVPALLIRWMSDPALDQHDLSSLRVIQSGGQRLQPEVRRRIEDLIASVTVLENFGMAEGMLMLVRLDDPLDVRMETIGRPMSPDDEVQLIGDDGKPVADGEVGELAVRGPYTLRGYFGAPEHNQRAFTSDGFYLSGDLMFRHPSGSYVVAGRKKDLINRGGEKISAEEIENLLLTIPAIANVACVPYPDPLLGERMCACVITHGDATLELADIRLHLDGYEVAKHKWPERVVVLDELPLSPFGKVSKAALTTWLAAVFDAEANDADVPAAPRGIITASG